MAIAFFISYFTGHYPPEPKILQLWVETWGEFSMLPFVKIPLENYHLFLAIAMIPLGFAVWILMAGTGKLFSLWFKGHGTYEQYLNLFGFSFFAFWILASIFDLTYSRPLAPLVYSALRMEKGQFARDFCVFFPPVMYMVFFGLGGVYNGIAAWTLERFNIWKAVSVGYATFVWPMLFISALIR
jgi:hypothetical protein